LAGPRIWQQPGFGCLDDLAASRMWQPRGFGSVEDVVASRMWGRRGFGRAGEGREPSPTGAKSSLREDFQSFVLSI